MKIEDLETEYQIAQTKWRQTGNKKEWAKMWFLVQNCCTALAKRKANSTGKIVPDLDDKITDATIMIMRDIKEKNRNIEKLSSYCYLRVFAALYAKKTQKWEQLLSLDEYMENTKQ